MSARPYEVSRDGHRAVVVAPDTRWAAERWLRHCRGLSAAEARTEAATTSVRPTFAWARPGQLAGFSPEGPAGADRTDPLFGFLGMDTPAICAVVRCLFDGAAVKTVVPVAHHRWGRLMNGSRQLSRQTRRTCAFAVRLAMDHEFLYRQPRRPQPTARQLAVHDRHVGRDRITAMWGAFGPCIDPFSPVQRRVAGEFCRAYGHDPAEMTWAEIDALWRWGPGGLVYGRVDSSLAGGQYWA